MEKQEPTLDSAREKINTALSSKKINTADISSNDLPQLISEAPEGETFYVPDENQKAICEDVAKKYNREDLKFEVVEEEKE